MSLTNAERLKRLYAIGKLTLEQFMEQVDAQLEAGTLDDSPPGPDSPEAAAAKWRAGVSVPSVEWAEALGRYEAPDPAA